MTGYGVSTPTTLPAADVSLSSSSSFTHNLVCCCLFALIHDRLTVQDDDDLVSLGCCCNCVVVSPSFFFVSDNDEATKKSGRRGAGNWEKNRIARYVETERQLSYTTFFLEVREEDNRVWSDCHWLPLPPSVRCCQTCLSVSLWGRRTLLSEKNYPTEGSKLAEASLLAREER